MKKYDFIKSQYPEFVRLEQLHQICNISKRSARYLLQHKIIPCTENKAKLTWRYQVAIEDIVAYLRRRDQVGSMIPRGALTMPKKAMPKKKPAIYSATKGRLGLYFDSIFSDCSDVLTVADVTEMTGLCKNTVRKFIRDKHLAAINEGNNYYIPKGWFFDFIKTDSFIKCESPSKTYQTIINGFVE